MPPKKEIDYRTYEVHSIRRKRIHRGKPQYMLKWAGWKDVSNTWETQESLHHMRDYVNDFDARTCKNVKNKSHKPSSVDNPVHVSSEEEDSEKEDCNVNIAPTPLRTPNRRPSHDDGKQDNAQSDPEEHILANPQIVLFADPI
ncbi:chromo domain-containing protein LHP1-like [Arachis ipaensis]|uniref:chromo domain-containing protein LHP1-like n=1 Tax=Arachis ipaensis TaxID=130454 RepID=UPI0007AF2E17|nr:chromo domain-containing protein LHP1-like [Arachis ipaensis]